MWYYIIVFFYLLKNVFYYMNIGLLVDCSIFFISNKVIDVTFFWYLQYLLLTKLLVDI